MERASPAGPTKRRRQADDVAGDLLASAAIEFAAHGFDGASTRRIAQRAGAHQPQINYYFETKDQLWRVTVSWLFELMEITDVLERPGDGIEERLRSSILAFLVFSAAHPELNRIINLEANAPSERLDWLVRTHLAPIFAAFSQLWQRLRSTRADVVLDAGEVWEIITSYGALHFATAPMLSRLGLVAGAGLDDAAAHAQRVLAIVLPPPLVADP